MGFEVKEQTYLQIRSLIEISESEDHKIEDFFLCLKTLAIRILDP